MSPTFCYFKNEVFIKFFVSASVAMFMLNVDKILCPESEWIFVGISLMFSENEKQYGYNLQNSLPNVEKIP